MPPAASRGGAVTIHGGRLLTEDRPAIADLHVVAGAIATAASPSAAVLDATGCLIAPGFVDLQCNGALGIDLRAEPERLWELGALLPRWGVTAWLPTIITSPPDVVEAARATLLAGPPPDWVGAVPLGLHLEGPFLSPHAVGAHPVDLVRSPSTDAAATWSRDGGIRLVTLAPELPGAGAVIESLVARGVVVSLGHSVATADDAIAAIDAGATAVTHLFNAMAPMHHRAPGLVGMAMTDDRLAVGLICDGVHVDRRIVRMAERALGSRLVLVSDAIASLGSDPGPESHPADETLAGATTPLCAAVQNLVAFSGCTNERAVAAASRAPADVLGDDQRRDLDVGTRADVVILDDDLTVRRTIIDGIIVHDA